MDEVLEFKSDKATYTARAGDDLLGGGQTAAVYRARAGDSPVYALKWLTDSVYEQRFFQEVDWLNELAYAPAEYGLKRNGQLLTPRVYDEQRQGERRFFVMDLATGQPLDEVLRRRGRLPEPAALAIAAQLARVFTALHEVLRRSYLDFQPRNVFWQEPSDQIMVIDWNLLSPKDRMDVAADLRSIGALLYRMLLGALPPTGGTAGRGRVAVHERWQEVSLGARVLLQDLLEPRPGQRIEDARTARDRLDALCQRWERPGDDLVREAAALFKQLRNGDAATTVQHVTLLDVAVYLDLAGRQTGALALSTAMAMVRHNLEQEVASRREKLTALARAISFFRSGDLDTAALLFEQALTDADKPEDELQVRRWQAVLEARHNYAAGFDGAGRQQIEALLERFQEATRAYLDRSLSPVPDLEAWSRIQAEAEALHREMTVVEMLAVEASTWSVVLALLAGDWRALPGETNEQRVTSAKQAKDTIARLPYADCLWTVLGLGDEAASVTAVEDATSILEDADKAEKNWQKLRSYARRGRWRQIDDIQIRRLFEETAVVIVNIEPVFDLLGVAIAKRRDAVARTLLEELAASAGLTEDDRSRVEAIEHWLNSMQRVEEFLKVWNTQAGTEGNTPVYQEELAPAEAGAASDGGRGEEMPALEFPASWILCQLGDLSPENLVKDLRTRLTVAAAQAVRICVRETAGLEQARLMVDHFVRNAWIDHGNEEWQVLRRELESVQLDQKHEKIRQDINLARNELRNLEAELAQKEAGLADLAKATESADERRRTVDQQIEEYERSQKHRVDQEIEGERASRMQLVDAEVDEARTEIKKEQETLKQMRIEKRNEFDALQAERDALQKEVTELREGKRQLTATTAVTSMQLQELERLRKEVADLDKLRVALEQENLSLKFRNEKLPQTVITDSATLQASGWQRLFEASRKLDTRILHHVNVALDELEELRAEVQESSDRKLAAAVRSLIREYKPWYDRNNPKWDEARTLSVHSKFDKASLLYEALYLEHVEGSSAANETKIQLAYCWFKWVELLQSIIPTQDRDQKLRYLEEIAVYSIKCQELARVSDIDEVRSCAKSITSINSGLQRAWMSRPQ